MGTLGADGECSGAHRLVLLRDGVVVARYALDDAGCGRLDAAIEAGTYTIEVRDAEGEAVPAYTLDFLLYRDAAPRQRYTGEFAADGDDLFRFEVPAGSAAAVEIVTDDGAGGCPVGEGGLTLLDAAFQPLADAIDLCARLKRSLAPGIYFARLGGRDAATYGVEVRFGVEPLAGRCAVLCAAVGACGRDEGACLATCLGGGYRADVFECLDGSCAAQAACVAAATPTCGDGLLDPGEACDDGGVEPLDGCSAACAREVFVCGNGVIEPREQCDDGGREPGGGCDANCQSEGCVVTEAFDGPELPEGFMTAGAAPWFIVNGRATSGDIAGNQQSRLVLEVELAIAGAVRFDYGVSSQADSDFLRFFVDGAQRMSWSGTTSGTFTANLDAGVHTLEWRYTKDGVLDR
ncbi:MAG: hypothetical protein KC549_08240, partial [Myxococcales bacterium]|nr:hypothetical protein [Myxococcales bacterium]